MKVLVVGKGGREHAFTRALLSSPSVSQVYALPGSAGMGESVRLLAGPETPERLAEAHTEHAFDLVVVGPEVPLVNGVADRLREDGALVFGPDQQGAQLEGSKIFSKEFMEKYNVPTARFQVVTSLEQVKEFAPQFEPPYVLKADGLAGGKGVFICRTLDELLEAADQLFNDKILGEAGARALLEQFQPGYELSFFVLTNGTDFVSLPMAQDHKRLQDNDEGPNTGGMGTVAPMTIAPENHQAIIDQVVNPTVQGLASEGFVYRGVVFIGIMMTDEGPQVLEYNVRFGDPETQVLLPLLDGDWGEALKAIASGEVPSLNWKDAHAACVVLAAQNYPGTPVKGVAIEGSLADSENQYFLHAGTEKSSEGWLVNGGRVLNAIGMGDSLAQAIERAYEQSKKVKWPGLQKRTDIGKKSPQPK